jgi:hypothetical protein
LTQGEDFTQLRWRASRQREGAEAKWNQDFRQVGERINPSVALG